MKLYDFSRPGWRASAGRFTQLVWRDTTTVGCAVAAGCPSKTFVCRYSPPGNVIGGDWATEVPRPLTKSEVAAAARAQSEDAQPPPEPVADITLNGRSKRPAAGPVVAAVPAVAPRRCDDAAAAARLALDRTNVYRTMHQVRAVDVHGGRAVSVAKLHWQAARDDRSLLATPGSLRAAHLLPVCCNPATFGSPLLLHVIIELTKTTVLAGGARHLGR